MFNKVQIDKDKKNKDGSLFINIKWNTLRNELNEKTPDTCVNVFI